jgi:hypothetical protein
MAKQTNKRGGPRLVRGGARSTTAAPSEKPLLALVNEYLKATDLLLDKLGVTEETIKTADATDEFQTLLELAVQITANASRIQANVTKVATMLRLAHNLSEAEAKEKPDEGSPAEDSK